MKANSVFVLIVLSVILVSLVQTEVKAQQNLIVVPDNFSTIQGAVDAASVGDTVFVKSGTYNESVWVDKSISLVGEGSDSTLIVGDNRLNGTVVLVTADWVNVTGFTVQPSAYSRNRKGVHLLHVRYCSVVDNIFLQNFEGIWLYGSSFNNIVGNGVHSSDASSYGVSLNLSPNNWIFNNTLTENYYGIKLVESNNNTLHKNTVMYNYDDGLLIRSSFNNISNNLVMGNGIGLSILGSNNFLKSNVFSNNKFNVEYEWNLNWTIPDFVNDIDESNTVNDLPLVYWVNVHNRKVPENSQFVVLVNCTNITVENLQLSQNRQGILMFFTSNSTVQNNSIQGMQKGIVAHSSSDIEILGNQLVDINYGVQLFSSFQSRISGNSLEDCGRAIRLDKSNENVIDGNLVFNDNSHGITFDASNNNQIYSNTISECSGTAVWFWNHASDNLFYLNNFVDNKLNVELYVTDFQEFHINIWDNGTVGNFWSDYYWIDSNNDGIGDYPHIIDDNNKDNYPLMEQTVIPEFSSSLVLLVFVSVLIIVCLRRKFEKNGFAEARALVSEG